MAKTEKAKRIGTKKLTIMLTAETMKKLKMYVVERYPLQPYGKISQVIEEALNEFLRKVTK